MHTESKDVNQALNKNSTQAQKVADMLKGMGVAPKDIQTTAFNVIPQQEFTADGQPSGTKYGIDNTIYVTVRDLTNLGKLLSTVVGDGANSINGIQFDIQNKEKAQADARKLAIQLYLMLRDKIDYAEFCRRGSHAGMLGDLALV